jgi:hypothetical protein
MPCKPLIPPQGLEPLGQPLAGRHDLQIDASLAGARGPSNLTARVTPTSQLVCSFHSRASTGPASPAPSRAPRPVGERHAGRQQHAGDPLCARGGLGVVAGSVVCRQVPPHVELREREPGRGGRGRRERAAEAVGRRTRIPAHSRPAARRALSQRTSGRAGASVHLSQQSPRVWWCASGSKHSSAPHQENALQGSALKGPSILPGRCALARREGGGRAAGAASGPSPSTAPLRASPLARRAGPGPPPCFPRLTSSRARSPRAWRVCCQFPT